MSSITTQNETTVKLQDGFTVRPITLDDLEAVVALSNIFSQQYINRDNFSVNDIGNEWRTPGFNLETDTRIIHSPEGKPVAYSEVWTINEPPVHPWVWVLVHPDYNNLGLGTYLTMWAEERARQVLDKVPADTRVSIQSGTYNTNEAGKDFLTNYGMTSLRHFWDMEIEFDAELPEAQWPDNITIKTYNHETDAKSVYLAVDEAFKDHWGHVDEPFETGFKRWKHWIEDDKEFDPSIWFLAMDGDEIAAMSLCRSKSPVDPNMGWVDVLGVRRPWRKRGLGLALLHHSFGIFRQRGKRGVGLGVDAQSLTGATRLYTKAGMHAARQFDEYEKELRPGKELRTQ